MHALLGEIRAQGAGAGNWHLTDPFDTVYLGGGTPSALAPETIAEMITALNTELVVAADAEVTLEANPEHVTEHNAAVWRDLGVSRVSLGVQSFDDEALRLLGREHTAQQARDAVRCALAAGFDAVSLDLIFAVPGMALADWQSSLEQAVDLRPHHISCYELTVHPATRFFKQRQSGRFAEASDDDKAEQFFLAHRFLCDAGYPAYEVSNFARRPDLQARHNSKYWNHTAYLGLGPSAHSFDGRSRRWWNERRLIDWLRALEDPADATVDEEILSPEQLVLEALAFGLRTTAGIDLEHIERRYGIGLKAANGALVDELVADGLLERRGGARIVPTLAGLAVADALAPAFDIPATDSARPDAAAAEVVASAGTAPKSNAPEGSAP